MSSNHRALVAGAGIAGLTAAAALHRLGWDVHLVDRRRTVDAAIPTDLFFPANGIRAFAALGAADALMCHGRAVERMRLRGAGARQTASPFSPKSGPASAPRWRSTASWPWRRCGHDARSRFALVLPSGR